MIRLLLSAGGVGLWLWGLRHWPRPPHPYAVGFWAWIASFLVLLLAWMKAPRLRLSWRASNWILLGLALCAGASRFYRVETLPFAVNGDEDHGLRAVRAIAQGTAENIFSGYDIPVRDATLTLGAEYLLGFVAPNRFAANRYAAAAFGTLSVIVTFLLARRLDSAAVATAAGIALTCSYWHLVASRFQSFYMQPPFAAALIWWTLARALSGGVVDAIVAGLAVGFGLQLYNPIKVILFAVPLWWLWHACVTRGFARRTIVPMLLLIAVASMVLAPDLLRNGWQRYFERTEEVTVLGAQFREQLLHDGVLQAFLGQAVRLGYLVTGRAQLAMGWFSDAPLLNLAEVGAALVGLLISLVRLRSWQYTIAPIWLGLVLGAVGLSSMPEASYRVLVALPALAILIAVGVVTPLRFAYARVPRAGRVGLVLAIVALIAYDVTVNGRRALAYLSSMAHVRAWDTLGRAIADGSPDAVYYVERLPQDFDKLPFQALLSNRVVENVASFVNEVPFVVDERRPAVFVTEQGDSLEYLRRVYANGVLQAVTAPNGTAQGHLFTIGPHAAASPPQWQCGLRRCGGPSVDRVLGYWDVRQLHCPGDASDVRWSGTIDIPDSSATELLLSQGYLVTNAWLDGTRVVADVIDSHVAVPVSLTPGRHRIEIAIKQRDAKPASFFLSWRRGDQTQVQTVPCTALAPDYAGS